MRRKLQLLLTIFTLSISLTSFTSCGDDDDEHIVVNHNNSMAITGAIENNEEGDCIIANGNFANIKAYAIGIQLAKDKNFTQNFQEIHEITPSYGSRHFTVVIGRLVPNTTYYYRTCVHLNDHQSFVGDTHTIITDANGLADIEKTQAANPGLGSSSDDNTGNNDDNKDDDDNKDQPDNDDPENVNANVVGKDASVSRLEIPRIDSRYDYICHTLSNGDVNYSLLYNKEKMHSVWVAYTYDTKNAQKNWSSRTDDWRGEPFYDNDKDHQLDIKGFGTGYDRGHICGSAERYFSKEANQQTFYMSNMSPMISAFNQQYWGEIEDPARDNWGRGVIQTGSNFYGGTLYIVKGGTIDKEENILGYRDLNTTNGKSVKVAIPKYYWMACLFIAKDGSARSIGFWLEHKDYKNTNNSFLKEMRRGAACSIDELESKTGIDFFCNLKDNAEDYVESTYDLNLWPGI